METIKAERDVIESELKSATLDMKDTFLQALSKDGAINEPAVSVETLGQTFGPLQRQVKESIEKQQGLIERIKVNEFVRFIWLEFTYILLFGCSQLTPNSCLKPEQKLVVGKI